MLLNVCEWLHLINTNYEVLADITVMLKCSVIHAFIESWAKSKYNPVTVLPILIETYYLL